MKAMVLTGIRQMEMVDRADPVIKNDKDVLIKLGVVGVCGSDVHYYNSGQIGSQVVEFPFLVGHECAGIVEAVGAGVDKLKPGDRIAVEPAISCWKCDQCLAGRHHTCRELKFLGCPGQIDGCLSEYMIMPEECCFKIPDDITLEEAAISEPLSIGVYAVKKSIPMKGAKIGILGCGPIGLSVLGSAKAQGAEKIYVTDKIDERLAVGSTAGADWIGNPDKTDVVAEIIEQEPLLLDVVFECCGQQDAVFQAMKLLKPGGKLLLIGIPPTLTNWEIPVDVTRRKEICIQNIRRQVDCVQDALDMIADKSIPVDHFVTHRFSFADAKAAFDLVDSYEDGVVKVMIEFK
jgi:L-iditol 2-dehydrogenase